MAVPIEIGGMAVARGQRRRIEIPMVRLPTETWLKLPLEVVHGAKEGPRLWISAAVHGDELNGVEIVRQILTAVQPKKMHGTLIAIPTVNILGFLQQSRYLPDRRDLNRCFPGSPNGSLASRIAHLFMTEVVQHCTHGIDLHTGSHHRTNLPQVRGNFSEEDTQRLAQAFAAPAMVHAEERDGSLREAASKCGIPVLVYEAGEPLRLSQEAIELGVQGILRVMQALGMLSEAPTPPEAPSLSLTKTTWVRARRSGMLRVEVKLGQRVAKKQRLGIVADAFGDNGSTLTAPCDALVIGHTTNPLVHQGDALFHLGNL